MTKNVLLVEYDDKTIQSVKAMLDGPSFEVFVAADSEVAKKILSQRQVDILITAALLPRHHGFELSQWVAQHYPQTRIIIISGIYRASEYRNQAIGQFRADDFFEKPLEGAAFKARVLELLGLREEDLAPSEGSSTTKLKPILDQAAPPPLEELIAEENKLTSEDIFGDIIERIDTPQFEIKLDDAEPQAAVEPPPAPRPPAQPQLPVERAEPEDIPLTVSHERDDFATMTLPVEDLQIEKSPEPPAAPETKEHEPVQLEAPFQIESSIEEPLQQAPPPEAIPVITPEPAKTAGRKTRDLDLDNLLQDIKDKTDAGKYRKLEEDISRRFEETLSGLGLKTPETLRKAPSAEAPQPAVPEKKAEEIKPPAQEKGEAPPEKTAPEKNEPVGITGQKTVEPDPEQNGTLPEKIEPANQVGDYILLDMIARGGMAEIYKAKKKGVKGFEKVIAIKKILSSYGEDEKYIEMFVDEAKIAAQLSHPNIVQIHDLGKKDSYYFIAMEYVEGKDLRRILNRLNEKNRRLPEELSLYITMQMLEALNYAHRATDAMGNRLEIVHRDISPPNIMISYPGDVKLTDFGVSKAAIKMHQTLAGALKGKVLYMSPEQARGEKSIDQRADIYSVGLILFELITGKKLYLAAADYSEMEVLSRVQKGEVIAPSEISGDIDPDLEAIIMKAVNKDREDRYRDAAEMLSALDEYQRTHFSAAAGSTHLGHFMVSLFSDEIAAKAIKVDLKSLPGKPIQRLTPEPKVKKDQLTELIPAPPPEKPPLEKVSKTEPKAVAADRKEPVEKTVKPVKKEVFSSLGLDEEKKSGWWKWLLPLLLLLAVGLFFMLKPGSGDKEALPVPVPAVQEAESTEPQLSEEEAAAAAEAARLEAARLEENRLEEERQAEAVRQAEEERQADLTRRRQEDRDRRQREAEEQRLRDEEQARLQQEAEAQAERDRLAREQAEAQERERLAEEERRREEQRRVEAARAREGDVVPLSEVQREPGGTSTPNPVIPQNLISLLPSDQTVVASYLIDHRGNVESVRLVRQTPLAQVNKIIQDTIMTWKFTPAVKDGVNVKVWKTFTMTIRR